MLAERDGDTIYISSDGVSKDIATQVPSARHDSASRTWRFPLTWAHCVMLRGVFGPELTIGPELTAWATDELERRVKPALEAREAKE